MFKNEFQKAEKDYIKINEIVRNNGKNKFRLIDKLRKENTNIRSYEDIMYIVKGDLKIKIKRDKTNNYYISNTFVFDSSKQEYDEINF